MKQSSSTSQSPNLQDLMSQVKSLSTQVAALSRKTKAATNAIPKRTLFSHEREEGLKELYADYHDNILADYIYGLYHPDIVFSDGLDIKSPSYMPIPTTTFKFKETFSITPNSKGNFVLFWTPNFLGTEEALLQLHKPDGFQNKVNVFFSNLIVNTSDSLDGNSLLTEGWRGMCFKHVQQDFEKYRLTSACIKVKYTGKVLEQAGLFSASANYLNMFRTVIGVPVTGTSPASYGLPANLCSGLSQFGDFDGIRQGQWADTCSVVSDPEGITCVYVPTDPLNQVFVDNGTTIDSTQYSTTEAGGVSFTTSWKPTNANISYSLCGSGLTPSVSSVTVECYYNFEIIVRQEQYPYFSPKTTSSSFIRHKTDLDKITTAVSNNGLVTRTKVHENPSVWSRVRKAFTTAAKVATEVYPYIRPLLKSLV